MSAEIAARLRQLAQDHHDGRLDTATYRSLRSPLLDSLVSNVAVSTAMEVTQPRAVAATGTVRTLPESKPVKPASGLRVPSALAVLLAVVVVAVGAYLVLRGSHSNGAPAAGPATGAPGAPEQVLELVEPFMDRGDWSESRLAALNAALLELGGSRIAGVAHDARFQRFVDELRSRLKEQQALSPAPLTADNSPLAALAVTVGIDLNSPDSALHITPLPPPQSVGNASSPAPAPNHSVQHQAGQEHGMESPIVTASGSQGPAQASGSGSDRESTGSAASVVSSKGSPASLSGPAAAATMSAAGATIAAPGTSAAAAGTSAASGTSAVDSRPSACRLELIGSRRPVCHDTIAAGGDGPQLALVPAGSFSMGSTAASEEQPVHQVAIGAPFAISIYEVSQGEFKQFCEQARRPCPSQPWYGDDYPVVNVSWDDARAYTEWLSATTHHHYRLPTEAQWEYAARAGHSGLYPSGDALSATDAQFSGPTRQSSPARRSQTFNANPFRLLHTVGNVREWVEDAWMPSFANAPNDGSAVKSSQATPRVARGGSYADGASRLRLSLREGLPSSTRDTTTGFRIVRELP